MRPPPDTVGATPVPAMTELRRKPAARFLRMHSNITALNQHLKEVRMLSSIHAIAARLLQSHDPKLAVLLDQRIRELMAHLPECQEAAATAQRPGVRVIRVLPRGPEVSHAAAGTTLRIIHIRRPTRRRGKGSK
jgi:hypothetical protein